MIRKINVMALAAIAAGAIGLSACSSKSEQKTEDTPIFTEEVSEISTTPASNDYAAIFADPAKQSEVATDSTYAVTASGLKYIVLREGDGVAPGATDQVTVHYEGKLLDGTIFDSSYMRGEPTSFPLNAVIPGWTEGLQLMKTNGKTVFYIPSNLAYGERGAGGQIPPNSDLIFTVELINVEK